MGRGRYPSGRWRYLRDKINKNQKIPSGLAPPPPVPGHSLEQLHLYELLNMNKLIQDLTIAQEEQRRSTFPKIDEIKMKAPKVESQFFEFESLPPPSFVFKKNLR